MNKTLKVITCLVSIIALLINCTKSDQNINANFSALPLTVTAPPDNRQTAEKVALGKLLFFDPILSGNKDVACGTCHHPDYGFSDGLDLSIGVNGQGLASTRHFVSPNTIPFAKRNSLSIINTAFNGVGEDGVCNPSTAAMFFDNRSHSLEMQSLEPIKTMEEMRGRNVAAENMLDTVVARLKAIPQYVQLFTVAFQSAGSVSVQNISKAIAAYERTIVSNQSPYDRYMRGDKSAMTSTQIQGMNAFASSGCSNCHSGPMFSDYQLHVLSVPDNAKTGTDAGANGSFAFRTPGLRNLAFTGPYMHSGVFNNLSSVLDFYDRVGDRRSQNSHVSDNQLDDKLRRFNKRDQDAIIQFLNALNDANFDKSIPNTVPSGLRPGGNL